MRDWRLATFCFNSIPSVRVALSHPFAWSCLAYTAISLHPRNYIYNFVAAQRTHNHCFFSNHLVFCMHNLGFFLTHSSPNRSQKVHLLKHARTCLFKVDLLEWLPHICIKHIQIAQSVRVDIMQSGQSAELYGLTWTNNWGGHPECDGAAHFRWHVNFAW